MGRLHGPNLTRGQGGRVATFTDADWVRAIRHGVGPDGRGLFIMPSEEYSVFSDDDLGALIAYLKTVPAVDRERPATALGPVSRVLLATGKMKLAAQVLDHANLKPAAVAPAVSVDYGRYVAASCTGCHGPSFSGGKIEIGPPSWPPAANLTPHAGGRLAQWTEADFIATMRTAKRPDGTTLDPVMPRAFARWTTRSSRRCGRSSVRCRRCRRARGKPLRPSPPHPRANIYLAACGIRANVGRVSTLPSLKLKPNAKPRVLSGHPWVFANEVEALLPAEHDGEVVGCRDRADRFLGSGIYNSRSQIVWRRFSREHTALDASFLRSAITRAIARREIPSAKSQTPSTGVRRLVWSESDDLPGLVVDQYADALVVQIQRQRWRNARRSSATCSRKSCSRRRSSFATMRRSAGSRAAAGSPHALGGGVGAALGGHRRV